MAFAPAHTRLALEVDAVRGTVAGRVRLSGLHAGGRFLGLNYRGGEVHAVSVSSVPASFVLADPLGDAARAAGAADGLELYDAALAAAARRASA